MKLSHFFFPWKAIQKVAGTAAPNWIVVCDDLHQPRLCEIISRWVATLILKRNRLNGPWTKLFQETQKEEDRLDFRFKLLA